MVMFLQDAFFQHERHGYHDQGHMMVSRAPFSRLMFRQAGFTPAILSLTFSPESLYLHLRKPTGTGLFEHILYSYWDKKVTNPVPCSLVTFPRELSMRYFSWKGEAHLP
jgi:hypothetical protein